MTHAALGRVPRSTFSHRGEGVSHACGGGWGALRSRPSPVRVVVFSCLLFARRSAQQGEPSSTWIATADARCTTRRHTRVGRDVWQQSLPQPSRGRGDFECGVRLVSFCVVGRPRFVAPRAVKSEPVPRPMRRARETRHACVPTDPELKWRWTEPRRQYGDFSAR